MENDFKREKLDSVLPSREVFLQPTEVTSIYCLFPEHTHEAVYDACLLRREFSRGEKGMALHG